jgi:hypothetical protein
MIIKSSKDTFIANTANLIAQSFIAPLDISVIEFPDAIPKPKPTKDGVTTTERAGAADEAPKKPKRLVLVVTPTYKIALVAVIAITSFSGLAEIALAFAWTVPTTMQQSAFDAMGSAWKLGFGALIGLIGGKTADSN